MKKNKLYTVNKFNKPLFTFEENVFDWGGLAEKAYSGKTPWSKLSPEQQANEIENYMKSHRPWTDRTGNARRGLRCDVSASKMKRVTTLELKHSVYYGVYLEYGMGQRFAIIQPTIRIKGPEIMRDMQGFINRFNL